MTTLIIGGTGFIGASLARKLVAAGERVVCMDTTLDPWHLQETATKVALVQGDIAHFDEVAAAIAAHRPDQIVVLAYVLSAAAEANLHRGVRVNVLGMNNVFEAARLADVAKVLYASSVTYHGANPSPEASRIDEDSPADPLGVYGWQKQFNEYMAARYAERHGMTMVAVRPAIVFGAGRRLGQITQAAIINEPAQGRAVRVVADPAARAALVHVDDVAELFFRLARTSAIRHAAYHTGATVIANGALADMVRGLIPGAAIAFEPPPPRAGYGHGLSFAYDHGRAKAEFGYDPPPLIERVRQTIADARRLAAAV